MGFSGSDELLALAMAKNILTLYKDTPIHVCASYGQQPQEFYAAVFQ
jgi:hypothetical protein